MSETSAPAPTEVNNPQLGNEMLASLGDEGAQRQLDMAKYLSKSPKKASEVTDTPTPADMVSSAIEDATDENVAKGYKQLIEELNSTRREHLEPHEVVTKNGNVVTRNKKVEKDPTRTDDLFDALATKLASTELSDDGLLTVLGQMDKKLELSVDEFSTLIDKIHEAREAKELEKDIKVHEENEENNEDPFAKPPVAGTEVIVNPFDSKPDISTKVDMPSPINPFDIPATAEGDESNDSTPEDTEDGAVGIPVIVEQTPNPTTPEAKNRRSRKILAGILAAGLVLGGAFGLKKATDSDNGKVKDKTEQTTVTTDQTTPESTTPTTTAEASVDGAITGAETGQTKEDGTQEVPSNIDISDWTWNVAHNLAPGQETQLIQKGIDAYNEANGTDFALKLKDGTTMIIDGTGKIVNSVEMEYINQLMINAAE